MPARPQAKLFVDFHQKVVEFKDTRDRGARRLSVKSAISSMKTSANVKVRLYCISQNAQS